MAKNSVFFVRHGEKEASTTFNSFTNKQLPLTPAGRQQSHAVGNYLTRQSIVSIYASDYRRALETATITSQELGLDITVEPRFGERLLLAREVDARTSKGEFEKSQKDRSYRPDGGESLDDVTKRYEQAVETILKDSPGPTAVFTHGRALQTYLDTVFSESGFSVTELVIQPGDVYRVDYEDGEPVAQSFVFAPLTAEEIAGTFTTLADTVVRRNASTKKVEKTHLYTGVGHNVQANVYEKFSLDILKKLGVPVPGSRRLINRGRYLTMNYISGQTLGTRLTESENLKSQLRRLGMIIRSFHEEINSKKRDESPNETIKGPDSELNAQCALNFNELTLKHVLINADNPLNSLFIKATKLAAQVVQSNPDYLESPDIIYGDFKPDNILIGSRNIYMIDPHLSYGRVSCDLGKMIARLYLTDPDNAAQNVAALLEGYRPAAYMLQEIRDMAGFDILNTFSRLSAKKQFSKKIDIPSHRRSLESMEYCLCVVVPALFQNGNILILRHLDDVQDFRVHYRNTPIVESEAARVPGITQGILSTFTASRKTKIQLIASRQLRAEQTADLVALALRNTLPAAAVSIRLDNRIRDLYHGRYVIPKNYTSGEKLPALSLATKAYVEQTFTCNNMDYRNGDPLNGQYSALEGLFSEFGESQRSFSLRFYAFMDDFLQTVDNNPDTLFVIVAHTATVFRMFELYYLIYDLANRNGSITEGELSFDEWQHARQLDRNPGNQLFIAPGELKQLNLRGMLGYSWRFNSEVQYLLNAAPLSSLTSN